MKKRFYAHLVGLATLAIMLTVALTTTVFYELFKKQVINDLRGYSELLKETDFFVGNGTFDYNSSVYDIRITIVDADGNVVYDSDADIVGMRSHKDRPEILAALKTGEGQDIRYSETFETSTFYYAIRVNDNYVIRVSKEASSILSVFSSVLPILLLLIATLIALSVLFSKLCMKSVLQPIETVTEHLDDLENVTVCKELKPFVEAIKVQHEEILKSANMRQEFTANVSHELKTPLASISGYSELIESGMATGDDVQHFAKEIHRNSKRLLTLINDIIRLSELDSYDLRINYEPVDLLEVSENCADLLALHAENMKVNLTVKGESVIISGGKTMIEEAIYNLCDNAIRYNNPGGEVVVTVSESKSAEGESFAHLVVEDNGIGISEENQKRVFERFYRVDKSRSKDTGGTGLGLAIVKHIARNHNAQVTINSELGKGTCIEIIFPQKGV